MARKIFVLLILLLSIGHVVAQEEFEFKIVIDHQFDSNDEIECVLQYDNYEDTYTFDEDSDNNDLEIVEKFSSDMDFNCDDDLDTIRFYVYDRDDDRIFKEVYENEDKFDYELELVDEDEQYFEFDIKDDFSKTVDCELLVDNDDAIDFRFDEDSKKDDKEILRNFDDDFAFECEDELEEVDLTVYDDDGDVIYEKTYYDKTLIEFDIDSTIDKNELRLRIDHDFDKDEEIDCNLDIIGGDDEDFTFDYDSDSEDLLIVREFEDEFIFDCDEKLDEIDLRIYDESGDKIYSETYDREDRIHYEYSEGEYDFLLEITNDFDSDVECKLRIDDRDTEDYDFDEDSSISDKRIEDDFNEEIVFDCDETIDKLVLYVFEGSDEHDGDLITQKTYNSKKSINYIFDINNIDEKQEEENITQENSSDTQDEVDNQSSSNDSGSQTSNENIYADVNESNLIDNGEAGENTANINGSEINSNQTGNQSIVGDDSPKQEGNGVLGTVAFVLFLILVVVVLILGAIKAKGESVKRKPKRKDKVDLEFLKHKKR